MKKVFAILLVLAVVAGFVFADTNAIDTTGQRITVKSVVDPIAPKFALQGSMDSDFPTATEGAVVTANTGAEYAGTTLATEKSIADENITAYFRVIQSGAYNDSDYARWSKKVYLSYTVGPLTEQNPTHAGNAHTVAVASTFGSAYTTYGTYTVNENSYTNAIENTFAGSQFTAAYFGRVENNQVIGTFNATWNQDPTAPNATYLADVTLTITLEQ